MLVMQRWHRTVQADLEDNSITAQRSQAFRASSGKEHSIGQHCGRGGGSAGGQNLADILQQKRLASGHKYFLHAKVHRFTSDPLHVLKAKFSPRRRGRGPHATIVTMKVAMKIGVEPQPGTYRTVNRGRSRNRAATEEKPRPAVFDRGLE
jgi:hypothetical protein